MDLPGPLQVYTEEDGTFGYVSNGATLSSAQQLSWTHLTRQNDATVAATIKAVPGSSSASSSSAAVGGNQVRPTPVDLPLTGFISFPHFQYLLGPFLLHCRSQ